jgi:Tfp pilus assembly protein PilF
MCGEAIQFHQRGQLGEAERIYRKILDHDPHHADSLHLLGVLAHQVGRDEISVELIRKAIAADKRPAAYHSNLGTALQALGNFDEAADSYRRALDLKPELAEAQMNLGVVLQAQGKLEEAEERLRRALALRPDLVEIYVNLGNILQARGKHEEAAASHERALALRPEFAEACFNLGNALQAQGKLDEAVASYERALALKPGVAEVHGNLGNALLARNDLNAAVSSYERALVLKPDYAEAYYNLGNARQAQEKLDEAVACYERALALKPQLPEAHYNLGNTLQAQERLEEAAASFERALAQRPNYAEAHYNLGCVLEDLGRVEEALACMGRAVEIKPDYGQARFGLALAQLLHGEFDAGWRNYEARWQSIDHDTPMRPYSEPLWAGERLAASSLLLWGEQGIGDEIMFAGLIPDAVSAGNAITLDCDARLQPLFARSFPCIEVVSGLDASRSGEREIAAHLPTGSLPGLYRSSEAAFAATASPYLQADPVERERFRAAYGDGRRLVGLAWHTNSPKRGRKRSIDMALLAPLFALPGIRWISLQYGDFDALEEQATTVHAPLLIDRAVDQFTNIDLFAAQVAAMDQVVTIDNSTAHLAGALGVPVRLLLPFAADWRWLQRREDSLWYPSLRLFRQPRVGDWQSAIDEVCDALSE